MSPTPRVTSLLSLASALIAGAAAGCIDPAPEDGPPDGYVRFEPTPIPVAAGASGQWVQYVAGPVAQDLDVVDIIGEQGPGGHHAVLYATPDVEPVGTTRDWRAVDQVTDRFLGGVGGEGGEAIRLPEGAVFRVPAGDALYINTHYLNATDEDEVGTTRLDVKLEPASPDRKAVTLFTNVTVDFDLPAEHATSREITCTVEDDLDLVMYTNHMHDYGVSTRTTITPPGGEPTVLKDDPVWSPEWQSNPNFARATVAQPLHLARGTVVTTTCAWNNTTSRDLTFPDEMCLFLSFQLGSRDLACVDGTWTN
ncbi:MAG TPA: hypothetical protein VHE35_06615 [Kofleriaceae bacterium]|nr:hypothetical protein [Kofleriaceae bacterium]